MANTQIEAVGTAEDIARAAYQAGFSDGYEAARMVIEVMAQDERESGGAYGADAVLEALDKARAKAAEMMGRPPVVRQIPVTEGPRTIN